MAGALPSHSGASASRSTVGDGADDEGRPALNPRERVPVGRSALTVSRFGLGTAPVAGLFEAVDEGQGIAVIERAWEKGIRFFDTAPLYGHGLAEIRLGKVLKQKTRDEFTLATKVGRLLRSDVPPEPGQSWRGTPPVNPTFDFSYDGVMRSFEESLERLGLDRVDIVHIHDPDDHFTLAVNGAYRALDRLRAEGVIGAGSAGMNQAEMLTRFAREGEFDCFLLAGRYTLLDQIALKELLPECLKRRIAILAAGVYNSCILADPKPGAHYNYQAAPAELIDRARRIRDVCARHDLPLNAAPVQFPIGHPAICPSIVPFPPTAQLDESIDMVE